MKLFKKIHQLLTKDNSEKKDHPNTLMPTESHPSAQPSQPDTDDQTPITTRLKQWIKSRDWKYQYKVHKDEIFDLHYLFMGFHNNHYDWHCIICINETNKLVYIKGIPEKDLPESHFAHMLALLNNVNLYPWYGNINLNPHNNKIYSKVFFDAEFSSLSDYALNSYFHGLWQITDHAHDLLVSVLENPHPNQDLLEIIRKQATSTEPYKETAEEDHAYFVASTSMQ